MVSFHCRSDTAALPGGQRSLVTFWTLEMQNDGHTLELQVLPELGFKSCGLRLDGTALQPGLPEWSDWILGHPAFGSCVLFPTPNRVREGTFVFQGRQVTMRKNGQLRSQHGLALDSTWQVLQAGADENGAAIMAQLEIRPGDDNYAAFPYACRLLAEYRLTGTGMRFSYRAENSGETDMPFGIGLHPWFLTPVQGNPAGIRLPARYCYETTDDLLPTGRLLDVRKDDRLDLNGLRPVSGLDLDTVYRVDEYPLQIRFSESDVLISASREFGNAVVFTPRGLQKNEQGVFCVESQSCATDAINLYAQGNPHSGLIVIPPGGTQQGEIVYRIQAHTRD